MECYDSEKQYSVSRHAKERYAERIVGRDVTSEIIKYINTNEEKINTDVNKMITYGQLIYTGKQTNRENKNKIIQVFLNGCWVVLLDYNSNVVITLYKVDLGCGDELNHEYIKKMLERIDSAKRELGEEIINKEKESAQYKDIIAQNESLINEYRADIKRMEAVNESYKTIIDNNTIGIRQAEKKVSDIVNDLIGKKEF